MNFIELSVLFLIFRALIRLELIPQSFDRDALDLFPLLVFGRALPESRSSIVLLYPPCLVIFNPRGPPGNFRSPALPALGYVSTTMAHNLYFIRSWYNWWQWGKVTPTGSVRPPVSTTPLAPTSRTFLSWSKSSRLFGRDVNWTKAAAAEFVVTAF